MAETILPMSITRPDTTAIAAIAPWLKVKVLESEPEAPASLSMASPPEFVSGELEVVTMLGDPVGEVDTLCAVGG